MEDLIKQMCESDNKSEEASKELDKKIIGSLTPKDRARLFREKKLKEDPNWDKNRVKNWREKNPEKYNLMMAKYFLKRLSPEQKKGLLDEGISV